MLQTGGKHEHGAVTVTRLELRMLSLLNISERLEVHTLEDIPFLLLCCYVNNKYTTLWNNKKEFKSWKLVKDSIVLYESIWHDRDAYVCKAIVFIEV